MVKVKMTSADYSSWQIMEIEGIWRFLMLLIFSVLPSGACLYSITSGIIPYHYYI